MVDRINSSASPNGNNKPEDPFKKLSEGYEQKNYLSKEPKTEYKDIIIEKIKDKEKKEQPIIKTQNQGKEISTTTIVEISKIEKRIPEKKHNPFEITKRTEYAFSALFVIALFISLLNFPFTSFMNWDGVSDVTFSIGWPMKFFEVSLNNPEGNPLKFLGLIFDISIYLIIAYLIDIISGLFIMATRKEPTTLNKISEYKQEEKIETKEKLKNKNEKPSLFKRKEILPYLEDKKQETEKIKPLEETNSEKKEVKTEEIIAKAKKAYEHYQKKGLKEQEIINLFKEKGWKEQDIQKLK